jgi:WD40 repeat protein
MPKTIFLSLNGELITKFNVNLKIEDDQLISQEKVKGADGILTNSKAVFNSFNQWCDRYQEITPYLGKTWRFEILNPEVNPEDNKQQAFKRCQEAGDQLTGELNHWLNQTEFKPVRDALKKYLTDSSERARILIETDNLILRQLPWQEWDFLKQELKLESLEIALSSSNFEKVSEPKKAIEKVKVLAVLGSKVEIKSQKEAINKLQDESHAQITWVESNQREKLKQLLLEEAWDIFFFAGHGETSKDGKIGRILIDETAQDWLTIAELKAELNTAIQQKKRLKLAIISACSGLGLAYQLAEGEKLYLPQIIVMKNELPVKIAPIFLRYFLEEYTRGESLYQAVQFARQELQELETDYPYASWLPIIVQNQGEIPPRWVELGGVSTCQPYRSLNTFQEEDAPFFFGREIFTGKLFTAIKTQSFLAIVGASGSGKSSVVYAGLIPFLKASNQYTIINFRPKNSPFTNLAEAILPFFSEQNLDQLVHILKDENLGISQLAQDLIQTQQKHLLLIVDQFEELYTLVSNEKERLAFIFTVLKAVKTLEKFTVLITLRGDFYGQAIENPELAEYLQNNCFNLSQMTKDELESAIIKPAELLEIGLERGLKELLINAIGFNEDQENQPQLLKSNLPLLSFTLALLWQRQREGLLTTLAYNQIGGLKNCLNQYAEEIYQKLTFSEQKTAEKIFIQLVQFNNETEDTRRIATKKQIGESNWDLVQKLADQRLIVTNFNPNTQQETAELVHEILIKSWQTLKLWLEQNRDFRIWQQKLRDTHRFYQIQSTKKAKEKALLKDLFLAQSLDWLNQRPEDLTKGERDFINQSKTYSYNQRSLLFGGISVSLIVFLTALGFGLLNWQTNINSEIRRNTIASETFNNLGKNLEALLEGIKATKKLKTYSFVINPDLKIRALNVLRQTIDASNNNLVEVNSWQGHNEAVSEVKFSADGETIFSVGVDGIVKIWHKDGTLITTLDHGSSVYALALSSDEQIIASGGADGNIKLWRRNGELIRSFQGNGNVIWTLQFSPDNQILASGGQGSGRGFNGIVELWNLEDNLLKTLNHQGWVSKLRFPPDGQTIITTSFDGKINFWNLEGELKTSVNYSSQKVIVSLAVSPDGKIIAIGDDRGIITYFNLEGEAIAAFEHNPGYPNAVTDITFTSDGQIMATATQDGSIKLWQNGALLTTLSSHQSAVKSLSFSPDGQTLVSGGYDNKIRIWQKGNSTTITNLEGHQDSINHLIFSPDSNLILTGSRDQSVKFWHPDGSLIKTIEGDQSLSADEQLAQDAWNYTTGLSTPKISSVVNISADGKVIVTSNKKNMSFWNRKGELINSVENSNVNVNGNTQFSPDGKTIAWIDSQNHTVRIWSIEGKELAVLKGHTNLIRQVDFSSDGQLIATVSDDLTVKIWKPDGTLLKSFNTNNGYNYGLKFSPDNQKIATSGSDKIQLWNLDAELIQSFRDDDNNSFEDLDFSPDGNMIIGSLFNGKIILWNINGTKINTIKAHSDRISTVQFSLDGQQIVSGSSDGKIKIFTLDGTEILSFNAHEKDTLKGAVQSVELSPNGKTIVSAGSDGTVKLWNLKGELLNTFENPHEDWIGSASFSPDGKMIVANGNQVRLWELNGKEIKVLNGHKDNIYSLTFDKQNNYFVSADMNGEIKFWQPDGTLIKTLEIVKEVSSPNPIDGTQTIEHSESITDISFSSNQNTFVSASLDNTAKIWQDNGTLIANLPHFDDVNAVSFSPNGEFITTVSQDKILKLWDKKGKELLIVGLSNSSLNEVVFSPDSKIIAFSDFQGSVKLITLDGLLITTLEHNQPIDSLNFSSDGNTLAVSINNRVLLYNFDENNLLQNACLLIKDYLKTNPYLREEDKHLCYGINPK